MGTLKEIATFVQLTNSELCCEPWSETAFLFEKLGASALGPTEVKQLHYSPNHHHQVTYIYSHEFSSRSSTRTER